MDKYEKRDWRKALRDAEKKWKSEKPIKTIIENGCPLCEFACYITSLDADPCDYCIYYLVFGADCDGLVDMAVTTNNRQPIFDAIEKMRKWLKG